jgi:hypothetical protein
MTHRARSAFTAFAAALTLTMGLVGIAPESAGATVVVSNLAQAPQWRPAGRDYPAVVYAMARVGDMVVLGGRFTDMMDQSGKRVTRSNLAAVDASTGDLLPWAPEPNGEVRALEVSADGASVYVGGSFTTIGSATRTNLAAIQADSGLARPEFHAGAFNGSVRDLLSLDGGLYVVGTFWKIGSANRGGGARLNPATGDLQSSWDPATNWGIFSLTPAPDRSGMFIGGPFSTVSGKTQEYLAKVSLDSGARQDWEEHQECVDPDPVPERCTVFGMVTDKDTLFVAAGGPGGRVTAFDTTTGAERWRVTGDGDVQTIALIDDTVIAGGHFDQLVEGLPRAGVVGVQKDTGKVLAQPSVPILGSSGVWSLLVDGNRLRVGGIFTQVGGRAIGKYTTLSLTQEPTPKPIPVSVAASRAGYGDILHVDVSPNRGAGSYLFGVQKKGAGRWTWLPTEYRTQGSGETRSISLPKGTYRVYVPAVGAYAAAISREVAVTDPTVKVIVGTDQSRSLLKVNVNPNKGSGYWTFRIQKRTSRGTWLTMWTTYKTWGTFETRTINPAKGTYRVTVQSKYNFRGATSAAVTLVS